MLSKVFNSVLFGIYVLRNVVAHYALGGVSHYGTELLLILHIQLAYIFYNSKYNQKNLKNHQD